MTWLDRLRLSPLYHPLRPGAEWLELRRWNRRGRPVPVPHPVKRAAVRAYARRYRRRVFIETGTYLATMLLEERTTFERLYSIELEPRLAALARRRCARFDHITILEGDSAVLLPELLRSIGDPALFWLDAHRAGDLTARGPGSAPIQEELTAVYALASAPVLLVDDAQLFTGAEGFPTLADLGEQARSRDLAFQVADGIVRITPDAPA